MQHSSARPNRAAKWRAMSVPFCAVMTFLCASAPAFADAWFVTAMHDKSVGIAYAPPNSTGSSESYPSLAEALAAVGDGRKVSGISLGYVLNGDLLGMQESVRSIMASTYRDDYEALLRSKSVPAAWKGQALLTKLRTAVLRSTPVAEMRPVLAMSCLEIDGLDVEKQSAVMKAGVPYFTAFVWLELKRCAQ